MFNNYTLKSLLSHFSSSDGNSKGVKPSSNGFKLGVVLTFLFAVTSIQAQTTIINPSGDGGFNNGSTFAANGWTVANQGINPSKWVVGTATSATTTASTASVVSGTTTLTLTAGNANIYPGMKVTASSGVLAANTYVSAITGTALTLTNATTAASATPVTLTFGFGSNAGAVGSSATVTAASSTITLTVANPGIVVGQSIAVTSGTAVLAANTYVTNVSGTTITLSQPTIALSGTAVTYSFGATSANISGNAAYVSNDGGATNTPYGYAGNRTIYFYRDVTVSAGEEAMTLTFDVKSPSTSNGWQVWAAPTSQTVVGTDTQVTSPLINTALWPGATLVAFNHTSQVGTTKQTAFIPKSFAGTTFRLIFVWTNSSSSITLPSASIDNISLVSRPASEINSIATGLWSNPSIWDVAVPTPADTVIINASNVVSIDCKYSGASDLFIAGTGATLQWANSGTVLDEFKISNDLGISGSGARFNVYEGGNGANGKKLFVAHDINVTSGGRFDTTYNAYTANFGYLNLNGSTVQTVTVDGTSFVGGTNPTTNSSTNTQNVIGQLAITNTSTATPNIIWNANNVKIGSKFLNSTGRISLGTNKITIGNYTSITELPTAGTGFIGGTVSKWIGAAYTTAVPAGVDFPFGLTNSYGTVYQLLDSKGNSRWALVYPDANPATAGEVAVAYADASTVSTGLSVVDGSYTINKRYDGNWSVTTPNSNTSGTGAAITFTPNATTNTFRFGAYATGGYVAKDGSSHLMNATAVLGGTHQDGTNTPFAFRTGVTFTALTASPLYIGTASSSMVDTTNAVTSATTGSWTSGSTWVGGVVPTACQTVIIASGHTVTVSGTAVAGNVLINNGATLVNASGALTVGCSGNNSSLENYGTYTCNGGRVTVNGYVAHRANSYFNHTGGDIIVDGNDNGNAATSVGYGGTIFKIETSNLNLTGGKITIVDPLVNEGASITASSIGSFTSTTEGSTGTFSGSVGSTAVLSGATSITMAANAGSSNMYAIGMYISGTGIATGTTIQNLTVNQINGTVAITLSTPTTGAIAAAAVLQFSSMANGCNKITLAINAANAGLAVGEAVSGTGIPAGTVISAITTNSLAGLGSSLVSVTLSNNVTGLSTNSISSAQTITFDPVTPGSYATVLSSANTNIIPGMIVKGTGLLDGTYVADITGTSVKFSQPIQAGAPSTLSLNFYSKNFEGTGAFVYDSPNHYAAGLNHTLQIGDGVSTQKGSVVTYGFNCVFQKYIVGGMLSLGNLIVDAPDGANRFMNSMTGPGNNGSCNMNVQGDFTIKSGSVFKKQGATSTIYVGGNLVNNGSFLTGLGGITLTMGNFSNGFCVPSTQAQTISGSGTFSNSLYSLAAGYPGSISSLNINNTSTSGVILAVPNFRASGATLTNGILHTSASYPLLVGDFTGGGSINTSTNATPNGTGVALAGYSRYVEGPLQVIIPTSNTVTQLKPFPLGKNGKFLPLQIAVVGGAELLAEAFDTNSGTTTTNASLLSSNRWKVTRVGTTGAFSAFNVQLGSSDVTASNILVQASSDQGTYDTFAGNATVYNGAVGFGLPYDTPTKTNIPVLTLTTAPTTGYTGYFSYAQGAACSGTPTPGNTVASTSSVCGGAPTTLSLQNATTGTGVTYQWQISTNGTTFSNISGATSATYLAYPTVNSSYLCNVSCSGGTAVASTPIAITISNTGTPTVTGATVCSSGVASLSASGSGTLSWYGAATGGAVLATGTTYAPTVSATTTYYVSSTTTSVATAGQVNPSTSTATATANFKGLSFDATRAFKLKTVTVYPKNTAAGLTPITIRLYDAAGNVVAGTSDVTFTPTLNTGTANSVSQTVTLNYNVPVGTGYRLVAAYGMSANNALGTNTVTAITFPAPYSSFTITGNVSDLSTATTTTANAYNCFFNIQIDENCETARVPVTATVLPLVTYYQDADGDGYGNSAVIQTACTQPTGYVTNNTDCNDANATMHASYPFYVDADHDTYGTGSLVSLCAVNSTTPPTGYSTNNTDCDDTNTAKWQTGSFYVDADADGYTVGSAVSVCYGTTTPTGYASSTNGSDCNDSDATVHTPITYYVDADGDGYGSTATADLCSSTAPTGYATNSTDCNDSDASVNTAASISSQPVNASICKVIGATASFTVVATPGASYQWYTQVATSNAAAWTLVANNTNYSGATSATLTLTRTTLTAPATGTKYKVVVTNACGSVTSDVVTLGELATLSKSTAVAVVTKLTPALTTCENTSVLLQIAAGSIGNVQWQSSVDNVTWTNVGTVYTQSLLSALNPIVQLQTPSLTQDTWFRVVVSNGVCSSSTSAALKITVSTTPIAGSISGGDVTVCAPLTAPSTTVFDVNGNALTSSITNNTILTLNGNTSGTSILWQKSVNYTAATPTWAAAGSTTSSLTVSALSATTWYRAQITNGACVSYTDVVKITVTPTAKAGAITSAASVCTGGSITFTSAVYTGNAISWEVSTTSATTGFQTVSGANGLVFTMDNVTIVNPGQKFYVRNVVTSGDCTLSRSAVKAITVNPLSVSGTISGAGTVCSGGGTTLKLSGNVGMIQWQYSTDGSTYVNVPTSTVGSASTFSTASANGISATYVLTNVTADTYFRAVVTSGACSSSTTTPVQVVIGTDAVSGTISALTSTVCAASGTTLTLSGNVGSITWQKAAVTNGVAGTFGTITGQTSNTLATGNLTATTAFRAMVTIGSCSTVYTDATIITVSPAAKGGTVAVNTTGTDVCYGSSKSMKVTLNVGSIQWQMSTTSATDGFVDVVGATTTPYTFTNITQATWFRVVATSGVCTATSTSNAVGITVTTVPATAGTISGTNSLCSGGSSTLSLTGSTGSIVWQKASAPYTTWTAVAGATSSSLSTGALTNATIAPVSFGYRAILTSGSCTATTDMYLVTVSPAAKLTTISGNTAVKTLATAICSTSTVPLTLAAGYVGAIQWQYYNAGNSATVVTSTTAGITWTDLDVAPIATYNAGVGQVGNIWYRVKLTSEPCSVLYTVPVNVWYKQCAPVAKSIIPFGVVVYPNPSSDVFNFNMTSSSEDKVNVMVYDMTGKLIDQREVAPSEVSELQIGDRYPSGVYNVIVTQGEETKTLRVIKR